MTIRSRLTCVGAFLLASVVAVAAAADTVDKRTTFTFNTPVAVPGTTLPAGSYLFRVADIDSHNVVQVLSGDGRTPYAMFFALQTWRSTPTAEPDLTFIETAVDMPHAIRTWWYPGETIGYEFQYSREQARLLALGSGTTVASIDTNVPAWPEPTWTPPTAVAPAEPAAVAPAPVEEPAAADLESVPSVELSKSGSPLTVMLATAIVLVAFASALQFFAIRKRT